MARDLYDMTVRVRDGDKLVFDGRSDAPGDSRAEAEAAMRAFWALFHKTASVEIGATKARPRKGPGSESATGPTGDAAVVPPDAQARA